VVRITSEASLHGFYRKPRVSKRTWLRIQKGLIWVFRLPERRVCEELLAGIMKKARRRSRAVSGYFWAKENFYLEIQDQGLEQD